MVQHANKPNPADSKRSSAGKNAGEYEAVIINLIEITVYKDKSALVTIFYNDNGSKKKSNGSNTAR